MRHGESLWNAQGPARAKGLIDAPMTIKGYQQSAYLRSVLKNSHTLYRLNVQLIIVSPLTRALETYTESLHWFVQESSPPVRVVVDARVAERLISSGSRGTPRSLLVRKFPHIDFGNLAETWWFQPTALAKNFKERQEPEENVSERVKEFLSWLSQQKEENILVIGHGVALRTMTNLVNSEQEMTGCQSLEVLAYGKDKEETVETDKMFRCNLDLVSLKMTSPSPELLLNL